MSNKVEKDLGNFDKVSLLGLSAGGAMAVATFMEQPDIFRVATVSSRLHGTKFPGYPSLYDSQSSLFMDTINWVDENERVLTPEMRKRVMTTQVRSGDHLVHAQNAMLDGARNVVIPYDAVNHSDAVVTILFCHRQLIADFIKEEKPGIS